MSEKSIWAKKPEQGPILDAGNYIARCFQIIQLGTQESPFKDDDGNPQIQEKVRIVWELPTESYENAHGESKIRTTSKEFTLTMSERGNLRKMLESWRGRKFTAEESAAFDITKLIGSACMLNIIHETSKKSGETYALVDNATPIPAVMLDSIPAPVNPTLIITIEDFFDQALMATLPDRVFDKISNSLEFKSGPLMKTDNSIPTINRDDEEEGESAEEALKKVGF